MAEAPDRLPVFSFGNVAIGWIAIGNVAFGGLAIGLSASVGIVAIGCNAAGAVGIGLNAVGPVSIGAINAIGVIVIGLVNAIGGVARGYVNVGGHPIFGIVLAVITLVVGLRLAAIPKPKREEPRRTPVGDLPTLEPGGYVVRATAKAEGETVRITDDSGELVVTATARIRGMLQSGRSDCEITVAERFTQAESDYRAGAEKHRSYELVRAVPERAQPSSRADLYRAFGQATVLASIASGGYCVVMLTT